MFTKLTARNLTPSLFDKVLGDLNVGTRDIWGSVDLDMPVPKIPKVEISKEKDKVVIKADLPGMSKDDIKVSIRNKSLVISGERRQETKDAYRSEIYYGSFERAFSLNESIREEDIRASYKDGVLRIELPFSTPQEKAGREVIIE